MKNKYSYFYILFTIYIVLFFSITIHAFSKFHFSQDDTVQAPEVSTVPVFDGMGDDQCWQNIPWQSIDNVWIPYNGSVNQNDYSGHYKLVWSSSTNLLYFLIEVNDDAFVDGFVLGQTADVYNFDIAEVFIDEDASGGEHRFDGPGTNAENAFAYHIYADYPAEGMTSTDPYVGDMAASPPNYNFHFPEFALRKNGNTAVWEFSLIVYDDTYSPSNIDPSRVQLTLGKIIGLSVAYCDNDNPNENPKVRDNMFGSVWEPSPGNLHWQNADYFGKVKLVTSITSVSEEEQSNKTNVIKFYPNPASSSSQVILDNSYRGEVQIKIFNILGQEVFQTSVTKMNQLMTQTIYLDYLSSGIYFFQTQMGKNIYSEKFIVTGKR